MKKKEKVVNLFKENGVVYVTSRQVAKDFGREHRHVLESVRELYKNLESQGAEVSAYCIESTYTQRGKFLPEFKLTRDGFSLLAMGFTGAKALKFKIEYINNFNEMESQLNEIDTIMNLKGHMSDGEYAAVKFSTAQRVRRTFLESKDIFKDYDRFTLYSRKTMDTKKRVTRLNQIISSLKQREDALYKEKKEGYRAERENIIDLTERILRDLNEMNNRSYAQRLSHATRIV